MRTTKRPSRLLIDDTRDEKHVKCELDLIARNYWMGITALKLQQWDVLYLDHDLHSFEVSNDARTEKTGYDIMCFLEQEPQHLPKKIICVSSNPSGRERIEAVVKKLYMIP